MIENETALSSVERISERTVEQIVHFPGEGLQDFRPGQSSPASSSFVSPAGSDDDANEPGQGGFRAFLQNKKSAKSGPHSSQRVPACFIPSTPDPQQRVRLKEWVSMLNEHGLYY